MFQIKKSGNEDDYTFMKKILAKIMLCSQLHCRKYFEFKHISYKIMGEVVARSTDLCRQRAVSTLETTQGQIDGFFSQLPPKCSLPELASVKD